MLSNPISPTNNSLMLLGSRNRSLRRKIRRSIAGLQSPSHGIVWFLCLCMTDAASGSLVYSRCCILGLFRRDREDLLVCSLMALKMPILSDPLINFLLAVTTANIQPSSSAGHQQNVHILLLNIALCSASADIH